MTVEFSTAELHGAQHENVGALSATSEHAVAIALSLGGAKKTYQHTDPNEDSAGFAIGPAGWLAVIADGHSGRDASQIAVETMLRVSAPQWTVDGFDVPQSWETAARKAIADTQAEILTSVSRGARDTARTTLAFALVRRTERVVAFASIGDSHIFRAGSVEAVDLALYADQRAHFLGVPSDDCISLPEKCVTGVEEIGETLAIVLATDGISERGIGVDVPETTVFDCVSRAQRVDADLRALETARSLAEAANAAHQQHRSGDNIATAALWIGA